MFSCSVTQRRLPPLSNSSHLQQISPIDAPPHTPAVVSQHCIVQYCATITLTHSHTHTHTHTHAHTCTHTLTHSHTHTHAHTQGGNLNSQDSVTPPNQAIPLTCPATSTPKPRTRSHVTPSSRLPLQFVGSGVTRTHKTSQAMTSVQIAGNRITRVVREKVCVCVGGGRGGGGGGAL